jgi:hypothetical protein
MRPGAFFPNVLADLKIAQLVDEPRAESDTQEQRRQAGESRARSRIAEDAERADVLVELCIE